MRFAVAALCVLALTSPGLAAGTCLGWPMPPKSAQQPPTVYYDQYIVSPREFAKLCPGSTSKDTACSYPSPTSEHPDRWQIVLVNTLSLIDMGCVVRYELSHLPPNYWGDPGLETPKAIEWLKAQRR